MIEQKRKFETIYDWQSLPTGLLLTTVIPLRNKLYFTNNTSLGGTTIFHIVGDGSTQLQNLKKHSYTSEEAQIILGLKTFGTIPVLPANNPTTDNQSSRKKYVDDRAGINYIETTNTDPVEYTIDPVKVNTVILIKHDVGTVTIHDATGSTPGHQIQVFNEGGSSLSVTDETDSYPLGNTESATFYFLEGSLEQFVAGGGGGAKEIGDIFYSSVPTEQTSCKWADYQTLSQIVYAEYFSKIGHMYAKNDADAVAAEGSGLFHVPDAQFLFARASKPYVITDSDINTTTDQITVSSHGWTSNNNGRPLKLMRIPGTTPTLPAATGYNEYDQYYLRYIDADTIELYVSEAEAINTSVTTGRLDWTDAGSGSFIITALGCYQADAIVGHSHNTAYGISGSGANGFMGSNTGSVTTPITGVVNIEEPVSDGTNGVVNISNETRPEYVSFGMQVKVISTSVSTGESYDMMVDDTGWISNSDWTNAELNVNHGLDTPHTGLIKRFFISPTGSDDDAFEISTSSYSSTSILNYGIQYHAVDDDNFKVQTGLSGILYMAEGTGVGTALNTQSWYYRVLTYKPNLFSRTLIPEVTTITESTSFTITSEHKDHVIDLSGISTGQTITLVKGVGVTSANTVRFLNYSGNSVTITEGTNTLTIEVGQSFSVRFVGTVIKRSPGRGLIFNDYTNTADIDLSTLNQFVEGAQYESIWDESTTPGLVHSSNGYIDNLGTICNGTDSGSSVIRFQYNTSTKVLTNQTGTYKLKKLWRIYD